MKRLAARSLGWGRRFAARRDGSSPNSPAPRLEANSAVRLDYEWALAKRGFAGSDRRIVFAVSTTDLDRGRGDLFVAVGIGRELTRLGWEVVYVERSAWGRIPPTDIVVAMLHKFDVSVVPLGTRLVGWVRNETEAWAEHPELARFDALWCSSEGSRDRLRDVYDGPMGLLPIGVDTQLFVDVGGQRTDLIVSTVNKWKRPRDLFTALSTDAIDFPLVLYGRHRRLSDDLRRHSVGLVSFFALPSLYSQAAAVLDDFNQTTSAYGNVNSRVFEALACGAPVITNRSDGLASLGLENVTVYDNDLHDWCRAAGRGELANHTQKLTRTVRERHSWKQRAVTLTSLADVVPRPRATAQQIVGFFPDYRKTNPYQSLLYSELPQQVRAVPVSRSPFDSCRVTIESGRAFTLHLHWTSAILGRHTDRQEAIQRRDDFLRQLVLIREAGGKLVWTLHNSMPHECEHPDLERELRELLATSADAIHVMCEEARTVAMSFGAQPDRILSLDHPSYKGWYPDVIPRSEARASLALDDETPVALCFGAVRPYKGLEMLARALASQRKRRPPTVVIAGRPDGGITPESVQQTFAGAADVRLHLQEIDDAEVQRFFRAADVTVLPYDNVLTSGAALLSHVFGVPIVAPETGCFRDFPRDASTTLFVPGSTTSLAEAIDTQLAVDPTLAAAAAQAHGDSLGASTPARFATFLLTLGQG